MKNNTRQFLSPRATGYRVQRRQWLVLAAALLITLSFAYGAGAATITVNTTAQGIADDGLCSLQEAILSANLDNSSTGCEAGSGDDTIVLPDMALFQMGTIFGDANNFMGPTATPMITSTIIIAAHGSRLERTFGSSDFRVFAVGATGNLTISGAHVKGFGTKGGHGGLEGGGGGMGAGGAIYVKNGGLTIESCTFEGNSAIGGNGGNFQGLGWNGGGGGLSGDGGSGFGGGAGGGGGSRGDGGQGSNVAGGGGGGTVTDGYDSNSIVGGSGGFECGGAGGNYPDDAGADGACVGGGGGGGSLETIGGNGNYGGGGGGNGGVGGFGGGGGGSDGIGGSGGVGGGGGAGNAGGGGTGSGGFGGNGGTLTGGGGAALGGAIFNDSGTVIIRNSTFTGNFVARGEAGKITAIGAVGTVGINGTDAGGAIFSRNGSLTVLNSTISGNQGTGTDAGIFVFEDGSATSFTLRNTIIANNGADECHFVGSVTHYGSGNFIIQNLGCLGNVNPSMADPQLGQLQLNAPGLTPTMAIGEDSPAFDAGDNTYCLEFDQRGVTRAIYAPCDIGAYEVIKNLPPVAICKDVTVSAGANCVANASIDNGSYDPDNDPITITQSPPGPYALGATAVTLTVADDHNHTSTCNATVTVVDDTAAIINVKPPINVFLNNHMYRTFSITDFVASLTDNCSTTLTANDVVISQVTSDEPDDATGEFSGDGKTINDIKIAADCKSVQLRQERDGTKDGRVYTVTLKVKDGSGNIGEAVATVNVPLSQNQTPAIDSGVAFTVTGCTP